MARNKGGDIEAGTTDRGGLQYPDMTDDPKWAFIRKVYSIVVIQLLITVGVTALVIFVRPIPEFFHSNSPAARGTFAAIVVASFLAMLLMYCFNDCPPLNFLFLGLFTICISFVVGYACAYTSEKIVLEAACLTVAVFICLTLYTFWAANRGHDFNFLGPFLSAGLMVIILYVLIQVFLPYEKVSRTIYGCLAAILLSGYIIYDTGKLINQYSNEQYVCAAISLYLDVLNLFLALLTSSSDDDSNEDCF